MTGAVRIQDLLRAARSGGDVSQAAADLLREVRIESFPDDEGPYAPPPRVAAAMLRLREELDKRGAAETIIAMAGQYGVREELERRAIFSSLRQAIDRLEEGYDDV